jgi:type III secretion protein V
MPWPSPTVVRADALAARSYRIALFGTVASAGKLDPALSPAEAADALAGALEALIANHAGELLGLQDVKGLLDALERQAPALVHDCVPKPVGLRLLTEVLRGLLAEGIAIRALAPILETLAGAAASGGSAPQLVERVRARLARQIGAAHARDGVLAVHQLDPMIEDALRDGLPARGDGELALPPEQARDIVAAVRSAALLCEAGRAVIVTQPELRRHLRKLLCAELPQVAVLSFLELEPSLRIERRAPIRIGAAPLPSRAQAAQ